MASRGGGERGQVMAENRMYQRLQSTTDRPVVGEIQEQTSMARSMARNGSQKNIGRVVQKNLSSSHNESSGRGRVDKNAPSNSVMACGNQVMMLRQKNMMNTTTQNTHKSQVQKQQSQRKSIEQENIGGISMLEGEKIT
jgi:hypothetical protein